MTTALKIEEKPAHTPGPWVANNKGIYPESDQPTEGEKPAVRSRLIALTQGPNARLIAAAPCMLKALKDLVKEFDAYESIMCKRFSAGHEDYGRQRELARLAIAKAEGEAA